MPSGRVKDPTNFTSSPASTVLDSPAKTSMTGISLTVTITVSSPLTIPPSPVPRMLTVTMKGESRSSWYTWVTGAVIRSPSFSVGAVRAVRTGGEPSPKSHSTSNVSMSSGGRKLARNRAGSPTAAVLSAPASTAILARSTATVSVSSPSAMPPCPVPRILTVTMNGESRSSW